MRFRLSSFSIALLCICILPLIFSGKAFGNEKKTLADYIAKDASAAGVTVRKRVKPPENVKGIYMTAHTIMEKRGEQMIDLLLENEGNTVVIDIEYGGGQLAFTPKNALLKAMNPGASTLDGLPAIIDRLHEKDIYVVARQVVFNDPYMSLRKPEWRIKNIWGSTYDYRWIDPSLSSVQIYNLYVMKEAMELGFDEIQFDYIRFPATNHYGLDYSYDENAFTRSDVIVEFLKKARRVADSYGVQLSVDVFGAIVWGNIDWKIVGQSAKDMAEYVDAIYPMTYPSHVSPGYYGHNNPYGDPYSFVYNSIEKFVKAVEGKAEIRTWIQGFPLKIPGFDTWFIEDQVRASFSAGATGFTVWSPGNYYTLSWPALKLLPTNAVE